MTVADISALLETLRGIVGNRHMTSDPAEMALRLVEDRGLFTGTAHAVVRPATTQEVADCVRHCAKAGVPVVPQGGNTGVAGGGVPDGAVVLVTDRLNRIHDMDALNGTMTVGAGCILADLRQAAAKADRLFALSLSSEGSCQIGGNLATNAGGSNVLRYGNARNLCLGLEVVLPDGRVWNGLSGLRKDNTGYDLKNLFIGAEGTLGIITAATLKLHPRPRREETAFLGVPSAEAALAVYDRLRAAHADTLSMFEYIERFCLETVLRHLPDACDPMEDTHAAYVLVELAGLDADADLAARLETTLAEAIEAGELSDAVIAQSLSQRQSLRALREDMSEAQKALGGNAKHDISVPVSRLSDFIRVAVPACQKEIRGLRPFVFGHFGDGNLHFNMIQPVDMSRVDFEARAKDLHRVVNDIVADFGGSISAEHGIGLLKRDALRRYKDPVALDLMARIKALLDPINIMNPGKVL